MSENQSQLIKSKKIILKAYTWAPSDDADDGCLVVIANNGKEAKKIGYSYWCSEFMGFDGEYIDIRVTRNKEGNIEGLSKGVLDNYNDGLKRGLYGYVEGECPRCGSEGRYQWDNGFFCWNCEGHDLCPKCSAWTLNQSIKKCSECDKNYSLDKRR